MCELAEGWTDFSVENYNTAWAFRAIISASNGNEQLTELIDSWLKDEDAIMPIFNEKSVGTYHLKAIFPKICVDDGGVPYVEWYVSDEINEQCNRRSEAAKHGWKTRHAKQGRLDRE